MKNSTETKKYIQQFKNEFWGIGHYKGSNSLLASFYDKEHHDWIINAIEIRNEYPVEFNILLANIIKSNFSFKLISEKLNPIKAENRFSFVDKVRLLKNAYESSYHYFSLITICSNYKLNYIETLSVNWYKPEIAKEYSDSLDLKGWKNSKGDFVSGKNWIVNNCPLFKFSLSNIGLLKKIRNAESHDKLIIRKDEIVIFTDSDSIHIKKREIEKLFNYVRLTIKLSFHFFLQLLLQQRFWIVPSIILMHPSKFSVKFPKAPKFSEQDNKKKKLNNGKSTPESIMRLSALGYIVIDYLFKTVWDDVRKEKRTINAFLNRFDLEFDRKGFDSFHDDTIIEAVEMLNILSNNIKKEYLNQPIVQISELNTETLPNFDFQSFKDELIKTLLEASRMSNSKVSLLLDMIIYGGIAMLIPLYKLGDSFMNVIIERNNDIETSNSIGI